MSAEMRFLLVFAVANSLLLAAGAAAFAGRLVIAGALAPAALLALAAVVRVVVTAPRPQTAAGDDELRRAVESERRRP